MRNIMKLSVAVATLCIGASGAQADDWTGFYLGLNAGLANVDSKANTGVAFTPSGYFAASSTPAIAAAGTQKKSDTGFTGGLGGGYNAQFGGFVVGVEGDFGALDTVSATSATATYPCCAPTGFTVAQKVRTDWSLTLRPRLGFAWDNILFYGTGGLAVGDVKYAERFTDTYATALQTASKSSTQAGWTAGGGIEFGIAPGWSLKGEYLYYDLGKISVTSTNLTAYTPAIAYPTNVFTHSASVTANIFRVGVNYRF